MECTWCNTTSKAGSEKCSQCGAPLEENKINSVVFDFSGVVGKKVVLLVGKSPRSVDQFCPSRVLAASFKKNVVTLSYKESVIVTDGVNTGSGAVATNGGVAAGAGGIAVRGNFNGNIVRGNNNSLVLDQNNVVDQEVTVTTFLPLGITNILISGNRKLAYEVDYEGASIASIGATKL